MTPEQRIAAERIKTIVTMLMDSAVQKQLAIDAELGSDRITRSRHAIEVIAAVLAARGYDVVGAQQSGGAGADRIRRMGEIILQQTEQIHELQQRIAELEGYPQ